MTRAAVALLATGALVIGGCGDEDEAPSDASAAEVEATTTETAVEDEIAGADMSRADQKVLDEAIREAIESESRAGATQRADEPADDEPKPDSGGYSGVLKVSYEVARDTCADFGLDAVAKEFDVPAVPITAGAAYGRATSTGEHVQASQDGCFAGFAQ